LKINSKKTKVMQIKKDNKQNIQIEDENIEVLSKFAYLGSVIDDKSSFWTNFTMSSFPIIY